MGMNDGMWLTSARVVRVPFFLASAQVASVREAMAAASAGGGSLKALAARDARRRLVAHLEQLSRDGAEAEWDATSAPLGAPLAQPLADLRALAEELAALPM
jgi:hypothetical protein